MPLPIALPRPTTTSTWPVNCGRRGWLGVAILAMLLAMGAPRPVQATPQQAPNSRIVLDLPGDFTPSPLFSGFQDDSPLIAP